MDIEKWKCVLNTLITSHLQQILLNSYRSTEHNYEEDYEELKRFLLQKFIEFPNPKMAQQEFRLSLENLISNRTFVLEVASNVLYVSSSFNTNESVPCVYDTLIFVFQKTSSDERQIYFSTLMDYYYEQLTERFSHISLDFDVGSILSPSIYEGQIKQFLPYVKFDVLKVAHNSEANNGHGNSTINTMFVELYECLIYPNLLREDCYQIAKKIQPQMTYKSVDFKIEPIKGLSGTLGEYFNLHLTLNYNCTSDSFNLFAKYLPSSVTSKEQKDLAFASFKKEEFFYSCFIPQLKKLGCYDVVDFAPNFYFVRRNDVLIIENVSFYGYQMSDITQPASLQWLMLSVKNLAKLHAASLLLEESVTRETKTIFRIDQKYGEYLEEVLMLKNNPLYNNGARTVLTYFIDKFSDIANDISLEEFKNRASLLFDQMYVNVIKSVKYRNVICHGDMWASNILFKENSAKEIISCLLVDFQLIKYCPPMVDLMTLIYTNTNKSLRSIYLNDMMKLYYVHLSDILKNHNIEPDEVYDKDTFFYCCDEMKSTGICMALLFVQLFVCPEHVSPLRLQDIEKRIVFLLGDRSSVFEVALRNQSFRHRMRELIEDLYDVCVNMK